VAACENRLRRVKSSTARDASKGDIDRAMPVLS
jgi:hypothetical protein